MSPPLTFFASWLWHLKQLSARIGRIFVAKKSALSFEPSSACRGAATSASAKQNRMGAAFRVEGRRMGVAKNPAPSEGVNRFPSSAGHEKGAANLLTAPWNSSCRALLQSG